MAKKKKGAAAPAAARSGQNGGAPPVIALSDHPRAAPAIRRAKALGGLGAFAIAAFAGLSNGAAFSMLAMRAVEFGFVGYLVAWAAAVAVWRRLLTAQATSAVRNAKERNLAKKAEIAKTAEGAR